MIDSAPGKQPRTFLALTVLAVFTVLNLGTYSRPREMRVASECTRIFPTIARPTTEVENNNAPNNTALEEAKRNLTRNALATVDTKPPTMEPSAAPGNPTPTWTSPAFVSPTKGNSTPGDLDKTEPAIYIRADGTKVRHITGKQSVEQQNEPSPKPTPVPTNVHSPKPNPVLSPSITEGGKEDTYTLVVVRCRNNITWLNGVPTDWRIVVYDKCNKNTKDELPALNITRHVPANLLQEECNGYYDYMLDYYHNLTTVNVFMHDDGLKSYDTKHTGRGSDAFHTPFDTFEPIVNSTKQFLTKEQPFLHFGIKEMLDIWGKDGYHGQAQKILWPYFSKLDPKSNQRIVPKPPKRLSFKPSAHMAVRKEAIQMHPRATYHALLQQVRHGHSVPDYPNSRQFCCAMERMWHIFFGQPVMLPKEAIVSDLLNMTTCHWCNQPQ